MPLNKETKHNIYHTISDVYTAALLPTKPSSDDDFRFRHGFGVKASLPLTQRAPAVTHNTTRRHCGIAISTLMQLEPYVGFFYVLPLVWWRKSKISQEYRVELVMKPWHLTSIWNMLVIQPFLTLFPQILIFFPTYTDVPSWNFLQKVSLT